MSKSKGQRGEGKTYFGKSLIFVYLFIEFVSLCGLKECGIITAIWKPKLSKNLLLVDLQLPGCHRLAGGLVQDGAVSDAGG